MDLFIILVLMALTIDSLIETTKAEDNMLECAESWNVSCEYEKAEDKIQLYFPTKGNAKITIELAKTASAIRFICSTMTIADYEKISSINLTDISSDLGVYFLRKLYFIYCPIPLLGFHDITQKLMVSYRANTLGLLHCQPEPDRTFQREHFLGFKDLGILVLQFQKPVSITPNALDYMPRITDLRIYATEVHLPSTLLQNKHALTDIGITLINSGMGAQFFRNQHQLLNLRLYHNGHNVTSELFSHLSSLYQFEMYLSRMSTLPSNVFEFLTNIFTIQLAENGFTTLPTGLLRSNADLHTLIITEPKLESVPDDLLAHSKYLEQFTLSKSLVKEIPSHFFEHPYRLKMIDMSNNKLWTLPIYVFSGLKSLEYLNLANNQLSSVNRAILVGLSSIQQLYLGNNLIADFSTIILIGEDANRSGALKLTIDLSHNRLKIIDFSDINTTLSYINPNETILRRIILVGNPIQCDERAIDFVNYFENPDQSFQIQIYGGQCSAPPHLAGNLLSQIGIDDVARQRRDFNTSVCAAGCDCHYRQSDHIFVMNCTKSGLANLMAFPDPQVPHYTFIELNVDSQNVSELPNINQIAGRENVLIINARNNSLTRISLENIPAKSESLDLSNNKLATVDDAVVRHFNASTSLQRLWLSGNPWQCDCSTQILKSFINSNAGRVPDYRAIQCSNLGGRPLYDADDLCADNKFIIIALSLCALLVALVSAFYFKYEHLIQVWLYANDYCNCCIDEADLDQDRFYDAFISFAEEDRDFVYNHLRPLLENGVEQFRLCIHTRDWIAAPIIEQIYESVRAARRTIIILSENYRKSGWCATEFRAAHSQAVHDRRFRIIIVKYGDIDKANDLDAEMQAYLRTNTYLNVDDPWFTKKLRYSLRRGRKKEPQNDVYEMVEVQGLHVAL